MNRKEEAIAYLCGLKFLLEQKKIFRDEAF